MASVAIETIISELESFQPGPTESDSICRLYEILDGIESLPHCVRAEPALFGVLERYPLADLGAPGPVVHALEAIAPYSKLLAESLARQPTFYTISMVGAILNSPKLSFSEREFWLLQLKAVMSHPQSTLENRSRAAEIIERHVA